MDCEQSAEKDEELLTIIDEIKNDSGLGVCDSTELHITADTFNCESNDSVIDKSELPELHLIGASEFPMPELIPLSQEKKPHHGNALSDSEQLPQLFPIPTAMFDSSSRRSSTSSSLVDSLLDKFRRNTTESASSHSSGRSPQKPPALAAPTSDEDLLVEMNAPVEMATPSVPNMLPTPIVKHQRVGSAFVTSDEEYEKAVAKTKHQRISDELDRSKMTSRSQPPKMTAPKMPTHIQQPRTLAEKRALVSKNIDFLMIEQESKVYKQIQRKKTGMSVNFGLLESIVSDEIPINYGPWKALAWLRTREGNYIQQYVNIDGQLYKLAGSRGNHVEKVMPLQSSKPFDRHRRTSLRSIRCCEGGKVRKRIIESLVSTESIRRFVLAESVESYRKLEDRNLSSQLCSIKPRPLCKKIEFINMNRKLLYADEDSAFLGDYAKFKMPDVKLQVTVGAKVPLHPVAKQYLNEIIPYRDMNENWIDFSLSALHGGDGLGKSFEFTVPYQSNKTHVLVREILKSKEDAERLRIFDCQDDDVDDMEWTFCKNADESDKVEMEVVDMIKDLTNSVFVNLNDDLFTRDDDCDKGAAQFIAPLKTKEAIHEVSSMAKNNKSKKVLLELRRLNANVVKTGAPRVDDEEDIRRHATAHLAKDEKELRTTVIVTESDTVVLGNKEKESRRRKKLPKRYSDYLHDESERDDFGQERPPAKKLKQPKELQDEPFKGKVQGQQKLSSDPVSSLEDLRAVRREVTKWLHVNVELRNLENLERTQPWCMLHNLYKCGCKEPRPAVANAAKQQPKVQTAEEIIKLATKSESVDTSSSRVTSANASRAQSVESSSLSEREQEISRRVLPIERKHTADRSKDIHDRMDIEDSPNSPKIEVLNISELVNGGIGPIFINVYDTKANRLNQIFRSILNNKSALAYIDGLSYFIDTKRIDVMKLRFDSMRDELDHPVFILQAKLQSPAPAVLSDISNDFVKLLFDAKSEMAVEIKDKLTLKQIGDVIESILQSVRKKIELQFDGEPNELVKEQLSMITRDRSNSDSSNSSNLTSPLHFDGKELPKAPEPGIATPLMREFNRIFSIRMQRLCAIIKSNSLGLRCIEGYNNRFYLYRWDLLLRSLEEELIQVWQAKLNGESGKLYYMMALTDSHEKPNIEHAIGVQNIKSLSLSSHMTELSRMILLKAENAKTKHMTVLLYGCQGYFRVCGIMNSKENYFDGIVAKPTRSTHPRLTAKIQKVYNIWYGLRAAREATSPVKECDSDVEEVINGEEEKAVVESTKAQSPKPLIKKTLNKTSQLSSYKWFLLNISDDFSDVYIKHWNRHLSYKVIMESIEKAKAQRQAIQLTISSDMEWPRIYALPVAPLKFKIGEHESMSENFLLFGPYLRNSNSYLLLMQNVDGKLYTRDYYEKLNGIKRPSRTRCLWIYANTLKCITNASSESVTLGKSSQQVANDIESIADSDDDEAEARNDSGQSLKISTVVGGFQAV